MFDILVETRGAVGGGGVAVESEDLVDGGGKRGQAFMNASNMLTDLRPDM